MKRTCSWLGIAVVGCALGLVGCGDENEKNAGGPVQANAKSSSPTAYTDQGKVKSVAEYNAQYKKDAADSPAQKGTEAPKEEEKK